MFSKQKPFFDKSLIQQPAPGFNAPNHEVLFRENDFPKKETPFEISGSNRRLAADLGV